MVKADVIAILKQNKGFINFPNPLPIKGPKKSVTSIDLLNNPFPFNQQVRVYHENGCSDWDWCESEIHEVIIKKLSDDQRP